MEALKKVLEAVNDTAAEYMEKTKQPIEDIQITEPMDSDGLNKLLMQGIAPDVEWDKLNREQRRRAKKILNTYKKKMNI